MSLRFCAVVSALALACWGWAWAADARPQQLFEEGNRLYSEGRYAEAAQAYRVLVDSGLESVELYYNLGNCRYKEGDFARAVLNYHRAERLAPGDPAVEANLALARSMTVDEIVPLPRFWLLEAWDTWLRLFSLRGWFWMAALMWLSAGAALCLRILIKAGPAAAWSLRISLALGLLAALCLGSLAAAEARLQDRSQAVIMAAEVAVLSAPGDDPDLEVFTLHRGTAVRIEQRSGEWVEVVLADGRVGWVKAEVLEVV